MGRIIAIYGQDGTGKTTLAYALGDRMANDKNTVLIVHTDLTRPVLRERILKPEKALSLGQLLLTANFDDISQSYIASGINKYLFAAGAIDGDNCISYGTVSTEPARKYLRMAAELFDTVLIDASDNPGDTLALAGLTAADKVVRLVLPNIQGILFERSYRVLFERLGTGPKTIYAAARTKMYNDTFNTEVELDISLPVLIPESEEADYLNNTTGIVRGCVRKDGKAFEKAIACLCELVV